MRTLLLLLFACSQPKPSSISFYSQPKAPTAWCYIDAPPVAPELKELDSETANIVDRVMIHRRDYAEAIAYMHDQEIWDQQVKECLGKLTE